MPLVASGEVAEKAPMSAEARRWCPAVPSVRGGRRVEPPSEEDEVSGVLLRLPMMFDMMELVQCRYTVCCIRYVSLCVWKLAIVVDGLCVESVCGGAALGDVEVTCYPVDLKGVRRARCYTRGEGGVVVASM